MRESVLFHNPIEFRSSLFYIHLEVAKVNNSQEHTVQLYF